jgi:hypothetical protein
MRAAVMLENTNNMAFRAERFCSGCTNLDVHKTPISVRSRESGHPASTQGLDPRFRGDERAIEKASRAV